MGERLREVPELLTVRADLLWPETEMGLTLMGKRPGAGWHAEVEELSFAQQPGSDVRPYDRLIGAALDGVRLPFAGRDAVEAAC